MKSLIIALSLTISFAASAGPVFLYPTCNTFSGECTLYNSSGKDVNCTIQVRGMTRSGYPLNAYENRMLYNGMSAWIRVYNPNMQDQITQLQATAYCHAND